MLVGVALVLTGAVIGWLGSFSLLVAPMAFRDLDAGRADRFVRNAIHGGHALPAAGAALAAGAAWLGGAPGGAALLAVTAVLCFLARFAVSPGARRRKATRVAAAALTAALLPLSALGAGLALAGV